MKININGWMAAPISFFRLSRGNSQFLKTVKWRISNENEVEDSFWNGNNMVDGSAQWLPFSSV